MDTTKVNFILPGFYEHYLLYKHFFLVLDKFPQYLNENTCISSIYGNFQFCSWDGGRIFSSYKWASQEEIILLRDFYNSRNIPIRFIFTNPIIQSKHYLDHYNNMVLTLCQNSLNELVINNEEFENYIRNQYPDYKFISSTTKCLNKPADALQELQKDKYYMVCLDYNLNKNKKFLSSISNEIKPKVEFLTNAICGPGCSFRKQHYNLNGESHLNAGRSFDIEDCHIKDCFMAKSVAEYKNNISPDEIYNEYYPQGFINFKLEGRTLTDNTVLLSLAKYLIKPEYQWEFLEQMLN